MTFADLFDELIDDAEAAVERHDLPDGSASWRRAGVIFASTGPGGARATFRLDPELAGAAQRTPDVAASALGREWVVFGPAAIDDHAEDRALAWFEAALRRAGD